MPVLHYVKELIVKIGKALKRKSESGSGQVVVGSTAFSSDVPMKLSISARKPRRNNVTGYINGNTTIA